MEKKVSTDTLQLSKDFMKALIAMDEKIIEEMKHPKDGGKLNIGVMKNMNAFEHQNHL